MRARKRRGWLFWLGAFACMGAWAGFVPFGTLHGWWQRPLAPRGDSRAFAEAAARELESKHRGNVVFALVERGQPVGEYAASIGEPVDRDTLFRSPP